MGGDSRSRDSRHIVLDGSPDPHGEGKGELLPIVLYINSAVPTHSPSGAAFDAAVAKKPLV